MVYTMRRLVAFRCGQASHPREEKPPMKLTSIAIALTSALLISGTAVQAAAPAAPAAPPADAPAAPAATFTLAAADATKLKTWITDQKKASVAAPAGFPLAVGAAGPARVTANHSSAESGG